MYHNAHRLLLFHNAHTPVTVPQCFLSVFVSQHSPIATQSQCSPSASVAQTPPPTTVQKLPKTHALDKVNLPRKKEEWNDADVFFASTLVPAICKEESVDDTNDILCEGVYSHLASKYGTKIRANQHLSRSSPHQRNLKKVRTEKREVKKQLRHLRSHGNAEDVRRVAKTFHALVKKLSKLSREARKYDRNKNQQYQRKECHKNFWKFAKTTLDDDSRTSIKPTFAEAEMQEFFATAFKSTPREFQQPAWMPKPKEPQVPFVADEITLEEIDAVIKRSKATSTPSPLDQIPYSVFKHCPSLKHALHAIFNKCWSTATIPQKWKQGCLKLLGKKSAEDDPNSPSNFRPITLTSCVGKLFT